MRGSEMKSRRGIGMRLTMYIVLVYGVDVVFELCGDRHDG